MLIGTGRSGTQHFATVCQGLGVDVAHEALGKHGIFSWCLVSDLPYAPYGPSRQDLVESRFLVGHQLRNPVKTIPSLMTMNKSSWAFIREDAAQRVSMRWWDKAPLRVRAMWHWLDWNQRAEQLATMHWTLEQAALIGPQLAAEFHWSGTASQWHSKWTDSRSNDAKSRISGIERLWTTSPPVAVRRWLHATGRIPATEAALFKADSALAMDIMSFWESYCRQYNRLDAE